MKITELAVKTTSSPSWFFLLLIALGIYSYLKIPQAEDPELPIPIVPVNALYPGASPVDMEELVVDKLEKSFKELENVKRIWSEIKDGLATVVVEFTADSDPDKKFDEVQSQLQIIRPSLPQDLYLLEAYKINAGETSIVQGALVSDEASVNDLREHGEKLRDILATVQGVKKAYAVAYPEREVRISVDLPRLSQLHIPVSRVMNAIQSENASIPGGSVEIGPRKFNVTTGGSYKSLKKSGAQ